MTDAVNHPQHYGGDTTYETIKVIEAWGLGFNLGNAVKYISRAERKGKQLEDLRKAAWYLRHEIDRLEKAQRPLADGGLIRRGTAYLVGERPDRKICGAQTTSLVPHTANLLCRKPIGHPEDEHEDVSGATWRVIHP